MELDTAAMALMGVSGKPRTTHWDLRFPDRIRSIKDQTDEMTEHHHRPNSTEAGVAGVNAFHEGHHRPNKTVADIERLFSGVPPTGTAFPSHHPRFSGLPRPSNFPIPSDLTIPSNLPFSEDAPFPSDLPFPSDSSIPGDLPTPSDPPTPSEIPVA